MKKAFSVGVVTCLLAAGLNAEILEQVLVKVNGEIITQTEFQRIQLNSLRELPNPPDPSRTSDAELAKIFAQVTPQAIVSTIDEMLMMQRAKELGMTVSDAQFGEVLDSIKKDNKIESDAAFEAALRTEGLTLAQLRTMLTKRILIGQVQRREIGARVDVTEAEEKAYYDAHPGEFGTTPSVTLREITVNAEVDPVKKAPSVGALDDARDKATAIRDRIIKGEAFDKVATEVSDSASKANGGLIGPISRDEMNEELLRIISTLNVGEITPVLNTGTGAQFFKLESNIESTTLPFESARARIADRLTSEKVAGELKKYVQRLRAQAII
jgi:peptidyl-prolyl cis-trans isomerase SurA